MKAILFVDSQSVLLAILSITDSKNPLVQHLRVRLNQALKQRQLIKFCWVPSHVGIPGNEKVDLLAASAKECPKLPLGLPHQDLKPLIQKFIMKSWQLDWDMEKENKLHVIKPLLGVWESSLHKNRHVEVLLCRLRIGQTSLTHLHLLCNEDVKLCDNCGKAMTVLHILWHCKSLNQQRQSCFPELFRDHLPFHPYFRLGDQPLVPFNRVLKFLHKTGLLHQL
uniref:Putative tick transposon n=1 Tax=Ixodes ricinus TaxID=34613 RepID=A0A6B0V3M1_IXORI